MLGMSRIAVIRGSWCSTSRLAKAAGAEIALQADTDEKWHGAVARSTFAIQNLQNTSARDRLLKFRCRKMARRCGSKHICKSKCTKHHIRGPFFARPMSKNGTSLWREAHFQFKMYKTPQRGTDFWSSDVEKWHAAVARSTCANQNVQNICVATLLDLPMWKRCPTEEIDRLILQKKSVS